MTNKVTNKVMTVKQEFESGSIGWEILFIFIAGAIGDMAVHGLSYMTKGTRIEFAQGLQKYYESLGEKFLIFKTPGLGHKTKLFSKVSQGAIWGGIACVIAYTCRAGSNDPYQVLLLKYIDALLPGKLLGLLADARNIYEYLVTNTAVKGGCIKA